MIHRRPFGSLLEPIKQERLMDGYAMVIGELDLLRRATRYMETENAPGQKI